MRSGYDELDTTLMPPRPGADPYSRNTPSPGTGGQHPGYTGNTNLPSLPHQILVYYLHYFYYFYLLLFCFRLARPVLPVPQ